MTAKQTENLTTDCIDEMLIRHAREQREFERHWLWHELGTTPKEFFAAVDAYVDQSGIDREIWNTKVREAKQNIETRIREQKRPERIFSLNTLTGLRA